jgi:hypothetical protein
MSYKYKKISVHGRKVDEHRYVMEQHLGRYLRSDEIIRWINGDVRDNRIENLSVMSRKMQPYTQLVEGTLCCFGSRDEEKHKKACRDQFGFKVMICDKEGNELMIVASIRLASLCIGCNRSNLQEVLKGKRNHAKCFKIKMHQ